MSERTRAMLASAYWAGFGFTLGVLSAGLLIGGSFALLVQVTT